MSLPLATVRDLLASALPAPGLAPAAFPVPRWPPAALAPFQLTKREAEVLYWIAQGKRDREIARKLGVSLRTIEHHVSSVLQKLGVETRTAAVALVLQLTFAAPVA